MARVRVTLTTLIAAMLLAGCHSKTSATPDNFMKALNTHYLDHSECLIPDAPRFPFETSDPAKTKQMDSLVKAQLLEVSKELSIHVSRYTPTVTGARVVPRFCYGHRNITSIDSFTPPAVAKSGFPETQVTYSYDLKDVPVWARTPEVEAAFPEMAKAISGTSTDHAILAKTLVAWTIPE